MMFKQKKRQAVIAGCGKLGARIAMVLREYAYEVIIIDKDSESFHPVFDDVKLNTKTADACDCDALRAAGIAQADCFFAATGSDTLNAMLAQIAVIVFACPHVYARIEDDSLQYILNHPDIHMFCSSELIAEKFRLEHSLYLRTESRSK